MVDNLLEDGYPVTVLDLLPPKQPDVSFRPVDLTRLSEVIEATKGAHVIYHLAAVSNVNHAFKDPVACVDANIKVTANVLEAARQNSVSRVIFASTVWVYNAATSPQVSESSPFRVEDVGHVYTATKLAGEMLCHSYWQLYQVPFTILRYGIPYGPRMREELVIPIFIRKALASEAITINGDGRQFRKYVYVEDLAEGNVAALAPIAKNQTYNLEGAEAVSVLDMAQGVGKILGGAKLQFVPARPGDFGGREVDASKAARELGWTPHTLFSDGLRKTVAWYLDTHRAPLPLSTAARA